MKGKRMLAALLCPMLTACAKDVNLDGMSEEELQALKEAVEQRLPTPLPKSMDLDAMDFDELIALRDAVEERLDPSVDEVVLPEGAVLLEPRLQAELINEYYYWVGEDIQPGNWYVKPTPNNYVLIRMGGENGKYQVYSLDSRGNVKDRHQEILLTLEKGDGFRITHSGAVFIPAS